MSSCKLVIKDEVNVKFENLAEQEDIKNDLNRAKKLLKDHKNIFPEDRYNELNYYIKIIFLYLLDQGYYLLL